MERTKTSLTTDVILTATSRYYQVPIRDVISKTRHRRVMTPRQMVHFLSYRYKVDSLENIATATGLKAHATVLHSFRTVKLEAELYKHKLAEVHAITANLKDLGYNTAIPKKRRRSIYAGKYKTFS